MPSFGAHRQNTIYNNIMPHLEQRNGVAAYKAVFKQSHKKGLSRLDFQTIQAFIYIVLYFKRFAIKPAYSQSNQPRISLST